MLDRQRLFLLIFFLSSRILKGEYKHKVVAYTVDVYMS